MRTATVAILGLPDSNFGPRLAAAVEARGGRPALLSIDAPMQGKPVTIRRGEVTWEGVDLLRTSATFVELPIFSWPQPQNVGGLPADPAARARSITADRERRALMHSAILIVAERRPVVNRPAAAFFAASPGMALDDLSSKGLPVHRFTLASAPAPEAAGGRLILDAAGRDRWHRPARPPEGEAALILDPVPGAVTTYLVVGSRVAGARHFGSGDAWSGGRRAEAMLSGDARSSEADFAIRAAAALDLEIAAVSIGNDGGGPRILLLEAGPDLPEWDKDLDGVVVTTISERLTSAAFTQEGART